MDLVPSADAFRALARSSPWRWSTLRCTVHRPRIRADHEVVRGWLRRPDVVRVETLDGALLQVVRQQPSRARDGEAPVRRPDGLVAERPWGFRADDPMYQDYFWVAMLDPVELADGDGGGDDGNEGPALELETVTQVDHGGRPAWEAVVRPTDAYEPRCGCCPLLRTRRVDELEWADHPGVLLAEYPAAFRVRLDVGTGVCVRTEAIGGDVAGLGHDLRIEAVDEPMDDALFKAPRRRRVLGWSPLPDAQ